MTRAWTGIDDVLRRRGWAARPATSAGAAARMTWYAAAFGLAYGAAMGSYAGFVVERPWAELGLQMLYSALKVPLLLGATCLIALPSFFVANTLAGLRDDFFEAVRAVAAAQAGLAIILASLAPLTLTWYLSSADYKAAITVNAVMFSVASVSAQLLLRSYYKPLIARNRRHRLMLVCWLVIYAFVGIQMGWVARPFIGTPDMPPEFFRDQVGENAYVVVVRMLTSVLFGR